MKRYTPLCVGEQAAAKLLDLQVSDFRRLVEEGHLPRSRRLAPGLDRWPVEDLRAIVEGRLADETEHVRW